MLFFNKGPSSK